ncbi:MAG: N-acetylglucosamine-6-phosphate deacetylase, partial [Malacoplasma sp.]|nr:N-acetylglucosamine-6-phosphate deacetylase [Malacoplasma sp.]
LVKEIQIEGKKRSFVKDLINGNLEITKNFINKIDAESNNNSSLLIDCSNLKIFPGFIDSHVHGGYGYDFEQNSENSYHEFAKNVVQEGVTKFVLASVTSSAKKISECLLTFAKYYKNQRSFNDKKAICLGVHLEGPFISLEKKGAHKEELIMNPNIELMTKWISDSNNTIRIVTFDIENDINSSFLKFLNSKKIIGSVGHSNSTATTFEKKAGDVGCYRVTHLFNAMSGLSHQKPGVAAAALNDKRILCELICDGFHVDKNLLKIAYMCKKGKGITLVTDAMSAKGKPDGFYKLGDLDVEKKNGKCVIKNTNTLAGSVATFSQCFKNFHDWIQPNDQELALMSSYNNAKQLNLDKFIGQIKQGLLADLTIVNQNYEVVMTICEGDISYIKKGYEYILK